MQHRLRAISTVIWLLPQRLERQQTGDGFHLDRAGQNETHLASGVSDDWHGHAVLFLLLVLAEEKARQAFKGVCCLRCRVLLLAAAIAAAGPVHLDLDDIEWLIPASKISFCICSEHCFAFAHLSAQYTAADRTALSEAP